MAQPVDRTEDRPIGYQASLQLIFSRKIEKHDPDQHGHDALAGHKQHDEADHDKETAQHVLRNDQGDPYDGMLTLLCLTMSFLMGKVVRRNTDDKPGDKDQGRQESHD